MPSLRSQLLKYGFVGALNTLITFLVIFVLTQMNINPYISNIAGFAFGLLNSFFLNSRFTFKKKSSLNSAVKFMISFAISYALNLVVLHYLITYSTTPTIFAQFLAMVSYNLAFFVLMKIWIFSRD